MNFGTTASAISGAVTPNSSNGISTEYQADNPVRMPVYNSPAQIEAARLKLASITGRSGRSSTGLVPGTGTYSASFLGSQPGAAK